MIVVKMINIFHISIIMSLIYIAIEDARHKEVSEWILWGISLFSVLKAVLNIVYFDVEWMLILVSIIPGIVLFILHVCGNRDFGMADIIVIIDMGFVYTPLQMLLIMAIAFIGAFLLVVVFLSLRRIKKDASIPFVPFITIAIIATELISLRVGIGN